MNTSIQSNILTAAARLASKVANRTSKLPILQHLRLQAGTACLAINATDLDTSVMVIAPAHTDTEGECCVPAKRLTDIAASCNGAVELDRPEEEADSAPLRVLNGSTFSMATLPTDEFPETPTLEGAQSFVITTADLRKALSRAGVCQSGDPTRYVLNGVFFELTKGMLRCVGTDGRRLAYQDVPCSWLPDKDEPEQMIVRSDTVKFILASLPKDKTSAVMVSWKEKDCRASFMFKAGELGVHLVSKLIEGNYPNYKQVIPAECKERVTFSRSELLGALRTAERAVTEKCEGVKMTLDKNNAKFEAGPPGSIATSNLAVNYKFDPFSISFAPRYVAESLASLDTDETIIELNDHLSPLVITAHGEAFKAVVMPMRLS